jgi:prepilin-type processing-associated H-X9-DG protein
MVILADQNPLFVNGRFLPDRLDNPVSTNHDGDGQNVLYIDGHVAWAVQPTAGVDGDNIYLVDHVSDYDGDEHPGDATDTFLMPAHPGR